MRQACILGLLIAFGLLSCASHRMTTYGGIGPERSLYYYQTGQGEPIILVHGGPGLNHYYFLPYMDRMASRNHMIYYDQKACGESEIPTDTAAMSLASFVDDIDQVRKKFGLKKFHLLGHSWGAMLAAKYAIQYPQYLSSLILVSPAGFSSADVSEASKALNRKFDYTDQFQRTQIIESQDFKNGAPSAMADLMRLSFRQNMAKKDLIDSLNIFIQEDYAKRNTQLKYLFHDLRDYDLYPSLSTIKAPTLIIAGEDEVGLPATNKINQKIPGSILKVIKECGHFPFAEQPAAFDAAIYNFLLQLK